MSGKRKKMKTYTAMSVSLNVWKELRAANGAHQFTIVVRAPTKKRVLELLIASGNWTTMHDLNNFSGLMENEDFHFQPPEDEVIYFHQENTGKAHFLEWLKLDDWQRVLGG